MIEQFLRRDSVLGSVTNLLISAGTLSSNRSDVTFANSNGVSFGLNTNGVVTASVATSGGGGGGGAGTGFTTATTAGTNVVGTLSTNGLSMGVPAYLTTADLSQNSSNYAGTGFTTATTAGTNIVGTLNAAGISMGVPAYLTTAMQSNAATISNINVSAGTTSNNLSAITFSNLNNVSFGLNGSTLTGSIATTYAGTGITTTTTAGTAVVGTLNTSGLSLGVPAYLTTAMQSNAVTISNINVSAGTTSTNASAFTFANANNVSFGLGTGASAGSITGSIATTYAGTGFTTATTAGTAIVGTLNTSGLSMGVPAFLTTAMQSNAATISNINISAGTTSTNASAFTFANANNVSFGLGTGASAGSITGSIATTYAGTGFTTATTAGTAIVGTLNTSGLSMGVPAFLTTAALSSQTLAFTLSGNSATTNSSQILNGGYALAGGANVTIQQSNNTISISAAAGGGSPNISAGTTSNNLASIVFANSNGVSFGLGTGASSISITATVQTNYLTTAALSSQTLVLSNSQTFYSTGTIALSEGGGAITIATSAGGQSFKFSVPQTSSIVGTNGISVSTNGSTISVMPQWNSYWANQDRFIDDNSTTIQPTVSVLQVVPFVMPYAISGSWMRVPVIVGFTSTESAGTTANTTFTHNRTYSTAVALYSQLAGASSMSLGLITSTVGTWVVQHIHGAGAQGSRYTQTQNITYQVSGTTSQYTTSSAQSSANIGFSTNQLTLFTSARFNDIPFAVSMSPGNYWAAFGISTNTASTGGLSNFGTGASMGMSFVGISHSNLSWGAMGIAPNNSIQLMPGLGSWSTNSAVLSTSSLQIGSISSVSSHPLPYFQIMRFA